MKAAPETDSDWAFQAYQNVRGRLPAASFGTSAVHAADLSEIAGQVDVFLLDAFGVLNVGERAVPGAVDRIAQLRSLGKRVMVVTNAAGYPKRLLMARYEGLGFEFRPEDVVSSREALLRGLASQPSRKWGLMASSRFGLEELESLNATILGDETVDYDQAEGFLFFGSADWTEDRQALLVASLRANPRPVLVGNPDIVAPVEGGLSREPGFFAHRLADETGIVPLFFGKPFAGIYDLTFSRLPPDQDRSRVLMVGDTLHTDILGGRAAGVRTALITDYGSLTGSDVAQAVALSGMVPDFILPRP